MRKKDTEMGRHTDRQRFLKLEDDVMEAAKVKLHF